MQKVYILIPTLNPNDELVSYVEKLQKKGFKEILVVNDGSKEKCREIFERLQDMGCQVINHALNLGKGRALKNGFNFFLNLPDCDSYIGVITVDSDGQHSVEDVANMALALEEHQDSLIMGCRDFNLDCVPRKSSFGNKMTRSVFRLLYGVRYQDTQTGLRGFPTELIPKFIQLYGERFEYETNMLIETALKKIPVYEVIIKTIYIDNNSETHFRPIQDSLAIYSLIFKSFLLYICSSLASFVIDIGFFQLFIQIFKKLGVIDGRILGATIIARVISSLFNYSVNKKVVFKNGSGKVSLLRYYILCVCQMLVSAGLVTIGYWALQIPESIIKIVVDTVLFVVSYQIQQRWVFNKSTNE